MGQDTDLDKLVIDVHTNGSIRPQEAVTTAARLLREMLGIFVGGEGEATEDVVISDEQKAFELHRATSIDDYADQLSVRAYNGPAQRRHIHDRRPRGQERIGVAAGAEHRAEEH